MKTTEEMQNEISKRFPNIVLAEPYKGANEKILIRCKDCGYEWKTTPRAVAKSKCGCPKCGVRNKLHNTSKENFIKKLDSVKFELIEFKGYNDVTVRCKTCGNIRHTTSDNILRYGCKHCASIKQNESRHLTHEQFVHKAIEVHGTRYEYPETYVNWTTPIKIICAKHGEFYQSPGKHLNWHNCPHCSESRGEELVRIALQESNIPFIQEKKLKTYKNIKVDFYIEYNNKIFIIEINGEQHYRPIEYFGGESVYQEQCKRDLSLQQYCNDNNIKLLIIRYDDNKLELINKYIKEITAA